tara:strand:- start:113 stop:310 length:198 start_codon:yes stop_codon:yes gene_type:complete
MEELIERLNGSELIITQHETRDEILKEFLFILGKILSETDEFSTTSVLENIEKEYVKILDALEGI